MMVHHVSVQTNAGIGSPQYLQDGTLPREPFWEELQDVIGTMKLRGSYGELGNQNTNNWYPTYVTMPVGTSNGGWLVNGVQPNTASAPGLVSQSLTWERVKSWDLGVDMAFFSGKLSASFDYYTRYTNDMVGPAPELPVILGNNVPAVNNTDLKTYGFELEASWKDRLENGLGYSVQVLLSDAQTVMRNILTRVENWILMLKAGNWVKCGAMKQLELPDKKEKWKLTLRPYPTEDKMHWEASGSGEILMYRDLKQ